MQIEEEEKKESTSHNDPTNLIEKAKQFKECGNQFFKEKNYQKALSNYHKVFTHVNGLQGEGDEYYQYAKGSSKISSQEQDLIKELKLTTHLNMAQIYINQEKFDKGLKAAQSAVKLKQNVKVCNDCHTQGLFRQGICNYHLNNLSEAKDQFKLAKDLDQTLETEVQGWIKKIEAKEKAHDKQMANAMKKMFI